jgi:cbb3-type cytochrome oxidase cytochrome c subunit
MRNGFAVFFAVLVALGGSWLGFVVAPAIQLGKAKQTTVLNSGETWPLQRTGEATLGLQIYRANGCAACHTEQIRQDGVAAEVTLTGLNKTKPEDFKAFVQSLFILPELEKVTNRIAATLKDWNGDLPATILTTDDKAITDAFADRLKAAGVKSETRIVATGEDIPRWGIRRSVAADFLYDNPVQLGNLRVGPDLANVGARLPDANWQLLRLYAPKVSVTNSAMPSFKFLFEVRKKVDGQSSPDALNLPKQFAPAADSEVVPKPEAKQLVAYLLSLRADAPLYEAPFTPITSAKP